MTPSEAVADADLARRVVEGDERAFAVLVGRYKAPLYRLLRRYTGDADEAQEAVHEAFIAAWAAIGRYDPERPFLAWLRSIAINKARDRGRRSMFRRLFFGVSADSVDVLKTPDAAKPADEAMIVRQQAAALDQAVSCLPANLKAALLLTAFEGLSQFEAGEVLGISVKAIETRTRRARQILARTLDPTVRPKF